ncbi:PTS system mannose/fructose/sorbose family transporter subunit IID [Erysipelothrix rhusiopathiae]|nr:PTS system mannose/fructose/sorbose family transporter subunit IID [Erysipelothrix rhusiopathiae]
MMMTSNNSVITKQDITKMALNAGSLGMEFSWNYERQMHLAFGMMMDPTLKKIYKDDQEGYAEALQRHIEFFNITPQLAPFVGGIVCSMEEKHKDGEVDATAISAIKTALMGPLSGIGDSIFVGCIRVIALGVGLSLAMSGNILGPIAYFLIYNIPAFLARYFGAHLGYNIGFNYLEKMQQSGVMDKVLAAAGILGIMVIGGMSKEMVYTGLALQIGTGETAQPFQEILDGIMPGLVGLGTTWLYYWLLKKKVNPLILIVGTMVVGIAGVYLGIFG